MAAGLGFKTFTTGEVLTAADVNGYLMQGILVFASEAARDAAITSPQEGQFAFTKDNNSLWYYTGSAWAASGATGDIEGVTAGIGISGGGTSGTVTITNSMATAIDAKGDLVAGTGADTFARLAVGANDTVLTADSSTATGLKWATPASGGVSTWTLLNSGGTALTGSGSITITGISNQKEILVLVDGASSSSTNVIFGIRPNGDSGINYSDFGWSFYADSTYAASNASGYTDGSYSGSSEIRLAQSSSNAASIVRSACHISSADQTGWKKFSTDGGATASGGSGARAYSTQGLWEASAAITSINIFCNAGNFDAGTVYVFGGV